MKKRGFSLDTFIQRNPVLALGIALGIILAVIFAGWGIYTLTVSPAKQKAVTTVTFGDGENSITVEKSGRVTIKTPKGTFIQQWDKEKIRKFFASLEDMDFDTLTEFVGTGVTVELTQASGEKVTVVIDEASEAAQALQDALENAYAELPTPTFPPTGSRPLPTVQPLVSPTPIATPHNGRTATPPPGSSNPWERKDTITNPAVFSCGSVDPKTGRKVVISNTVCIQ